MNLEITKKLYKFILNDHHNVTLSPEIIGMFHLSKGHFCAVKGFDKLSQKMLQSIFKQLLSKGVFKKKVNTSNKNCCLNFYFFIVVIMKMKLYNVVIGID